MEETGEPHGETPVARFQRLERIFLRAGELEEGERGAYVASACAGDDALHREVLGMLGLEQSAERKLRSTVDSGLLTLPAEPIPDRLGAYRILEPLGHGGLGSVYLAERDDGHFSKQVAIKWLRPQMAGIELERRFRLERQVLATLEHPHIARILDGGTHRGAAYLVMERIRGHHLLEHCRRQDLSVTEKVKLFRKICAAVHHAHQNLILHCDLKPSNILVDENGEPKLVDFGIAKALGPQLQEAGSQNEGSQNAGAQNAGAQDSDVPNVEVSNVRAREEDEQEAEAQGSRAQLGEARARIEAAAATRTRAGLRPLTPEYASPEQACFRPLTTASDVYSLGVVLFEMLCDSRPYRLDAHPSLDIAAVISESAVPRPSERHREQQGTAAPWGSDLDAIVARAMRKEPEERYRSVEQLSEDLLRYLEHRPVLAARGPWFSPFLKLVRRHRIATLTAALFLLMLAGATVVTSRQARIAEAERHRAEQSLRIAQEEKDRAEAVVDLLVGLFEVSDPSQAAGDVSARQVLDRGSSGIRERLQDRPRVRAALAATIGRVYRELALFDEAQLHLEDSLQTRRRELDPTSPEVVDSMLQLALLRLDQNRLDDAERLTGSALELEKQGRGEATATSGRLLLTQALVHLQKAQAPKARAALEDFLRLPLPPDQRSPADRGEAFDLLAEVSYAEGDYEAAEALALAGLEVRRGALGGEHPKVARSLNNLAAIRVAKGDLSGARSAFEETLELRRRAYGETHGAVAQSLQNLAVVHMREKAPELAEQRLGQALRIMRSVHGETHPSVAEVLHTWARLESLRGRPEKAAALHRQAFEIRRGGLGPGHPNTVLSLLGLADSLRNADAETAEIHYREAIELQRKQPELHGHRRAFPLERLGRLICPNRPREGAELLAEALEVRLASPAADHPTTALGRAHLGRCVARFDRDRGERHLRQAVAHLEARLGAEHSSTTRAHRWLEELAEH